MRFLITILFLTCLGIAAYTGMSSTLSGSPEAVAVKLIDSLRAGNIQKAVSLFGDNTCKCPPPGGYISFLRYQSGHSPNLAFLVGRSFKSGKARVALLPAKGAYLLPWEKPEDCELTIPLTFTTYQPYFLPLESAYGANVKKAELEKYLEDPARDAWRAFSLRLRPKVAAGLIRYGSRQRAGKTVEKLLPSEILKYMRPQNPGKILRADGTAESMEAYVDKLPRLRSVLLQLRATRRGPFRQWQIADINFVEAVLADGAGRRITL